MSRRPLSSELALALCFLVIIFGVPITQIGIQLSRGERAQFADHAQYIFCSIVLGEKNPAPKIEQTRSAKADLIAALKDAFTYCDKAYDGMTDASATQMVTLFGGDTPKLGVLTANNMHTWEHYGNLVTYMRMKNIVPPTSEPGFMPQQPKK